MSDITPDGTAWIENVRLSAEQVREMDPAHMKDGLLRTIERAEAKAREMGMSKPEVTIRFDAEFLIVIDHDEPDPVPVASLPDLDVRAVEES